MCQEQKKQIYMWPSHWEKPAAHGDYGAVSCNNSYAARAGLWILKNGGNAFDAAAAVSLALSVVEPHHSGIGGGCFSLLYCEKEGRILTRETGWEEKKNPGGGGGGGVGEKQKPECPRG